MKAIRDRIPRNTPGRRYGRMVDGSAYVDLLVAKLHEEASEVNEAVLKDMGDKQAIANELADVVEVAYAIGERLGISRKIIAQMRTDKEFERGVFDEGWVIA